MSRYETEEEQVEAIKSWWKKNGTAVLSAVLVVVIAIGGYRYWTNTNYVNSVNASNLFEVLQVNSQRGTFGEVSREALKLIQEQPESPYAAGAAMLYAKFSLDKGEIAEAKQHLTWVADNAKDMQLKNTARLNLVRIQADQKEFDAAEQNLAQLAKANLKGAEKAVFDYVSGSVALAQAKADDAIAAFDRVVKNDQAEKNLLGLAQIQLDDLAK